MTMRSGILAALVLMPLTASSLALAGHAWAGSVERAYELAENHQCDAALSTLVDVDPGDVQGALIGAQCEIALRRWPAALERIERAWPGLASSAHAHLYRGMAEFNLGRMQDARRSLARAAEHLDQSAELHFYQGLLWMRDGRARAAAQSFRRAGDVGTPRVKRAATYYEVLAWISDGDRSRAAARFRVLELVAADTVYVVRARRALDRLRNQRWLSLSVGREVDRHTVVGSGQTNLPSEISDERDTRWLWKVQSGAQLLRGTDWSVRGLASVAGALHDDLDAFDSIASRGSVWLDRRMDERLTGRIQYSFSQLILDGDSYQRSHSLRPMLIRGWDDANTTRAFAQLWTSDSLIEASDVPDGNGTPGAPCPGVGVAFCGPPGLSESSSRDRDGLGWSVGVEHTTNFSQRGVRLSLGYTYQRFSADGREYSYRGHLLRSSARWVFGTGWQLDGALSVAYRPFDRRSSFAEPRDLVPGQEYGLDGRHRRDLVRGAQLGLQKRLTDRIAASLRYAYSDSDSNVTVFDYDRSVLGVYLSYRMPL